MNLRTVALLPVSADTPILEFAQKLYDSLREMNANPGLIQTRSIMNHLGRHAFTRLGRLKLMSWLHEQEETHRIVLYVADGGVTAPWTQRCIRQVNSVMLSYWMMLISHCIYRLIVSCWWVCRKATPLLESTSSCC